MAGYPAQHLSRYIQLAGYLAIYPVSSWISIQYLYFAGYPIANPYMKPVFAGPDIVS